MAGKKFDVRRAPAGQLDARPKNTCRGIIIGAGGDIKKVNIGMVNAAAAKQGLPAYELAARLRSLGANL